MSMLGLVQLWKCRRGWDAYKREGDARRKLCGQTCLATAIAARLLEALKLHLVLVMLDSGSEYGWLCLFEALVFCECASRILGTVL
jgi:hypothetical protein